MNDNELRVGSVLRQALAASWPNIGRWLALSALVQTPLIFYTLSGLRQQLPHEPLFMAIHSAVHVAFYVIAEAAVTAAMLAHLRGQRVRVGELLSMVVRPAPLLGFAIAYGLLNGLFALVPFSLHLWPSYWLPSWLNFVCDALLYLFLAVIVPVLVNERTGALEALKRSVALTRGHRGRLLGLFTLIYLACHFAMNFPVMLWASTFYVTESSVENMTRWLLAGSVLAPLIWGAANTSVYRTLRQVKERVDILDTPSVPDAHIHAPD